jgi:transposase
MEIPNHSLPQITPEVLNKLTRDELLPLSVKLLKDLKELHDRLNQNPKNSSRPSSSMPAWGKNDDSTETIEDSTADIKSTLESEKTINDKKENEKVSPELNAAQGLLKPSTLKNDNADKPAPKKPGKQTGSVGAGRSWDPEITEVAIHCFAESCVVCNHILEIKHQRCYTQYKQVDIQLGDRFNPGLRIIVTPYFLYELECSYCDHFNRYDPKSTIAIKNSVWEKIELSEWRWIGPNLAAFIAHLKMEFRLPIRKIRDLLSYFGIFLSTGVIAQCYEESGAAVSTLEKGIIDALLKESLVHADETIWLEKSKTLWLWIFSTISVTYFCVGKRTKEQLQDVLQASFSGWLMTDGYGAYRHYEKRLRCWAHLLRKAKGLSESTDAIAMSYGHCALNLFEICMNEIYQWRKEIHPKEKTDVLINRLSPLLDEFYQRCEKYSADTILHDKTKALAREFLNDWSAIFRILEHPYLPLTNNEAERGLRPWVLLRKICFGSKSAKGTKTFTLLASVIETCKKRSIHSMRFLSESILAARKGQFMDMIPAV